MRALNTAATGMKAQEMNLDVIAHNLANVNTAGFKRSEVNFEDLLYVNIRSAGVTDSNGTESASGLQVGSGAAAVSTTAHHGQGTLQQTDRPLDVAIDGVGFFKVDLPSGETRYTRNGSFKLNSAGEIITADGYSLNLGAVPAGASVQILSDGSVKARVAGETESTDLGKIQLYTFSNPAGLESKGGNLFIESEASGTSTPANPGSAGAGVLKSGYLERSNVDVVSELIRMIMAQRAYEVNSRAIKAGDEMLSVSNRLGS